MLQEHHEHATELVWYENGRIYTQTEYLTMLWGRAVREDEAVHFCRKQMFIRDFINYSKQQHA